MKPRIVHIIDRLPPDGAERLLCEILRYRSDAFDYQVLCLVEGGVFEPVIRAMGVPVTILGKRPGVDLRMAWRLWRWCMGWKGFSFCAGCGAGFAAGQRSLGRRW